MVYKVLSCISSKTGIRGDYVQHFGICFFTTLLGGLLSSTVVFLFLGYRPALVAGMFGAVLSLGLSLGKEMGDKANPNSGWSWWDLLADGLGIVAGLIVYFLIFCCLFQ